MFLVHNFLCHWLLHTFSSFSLYLGVLFTLIASFAQSFNYCSSDNFLLFFSFVTNILCLKCHMLSILFSSTVLVCSFHFILFHFKLTLKYILSICLYQFPLLPYSLRHCDRLFLSPLISPPISPSGTGLFFHIRPSLIRQQEYHKDRFMHTRAHTHILSVLTQCT